MNSLLCLPNEVLSIIVARFHRDDIENFALSCKTILEVSESALIKHRSRKKYSKTILKPRFDACLPHLLFRKTSIERHIFQIIRQLFDDEELALYISSLRIDASGIEPLEDHEEEDIEEAAEDDEDSENEGPEDLGLSKEQPKTSDLDLDRETNVDDFDMIDYTDEEQDRQYPHGSFERVKTEFEILPASYRERILALLRKLPCQWSEKDLQSMVSAITRGIQGASIGLLLCMLPNLAKLSIYAYSNDDKWPSDILNIVVGRTAESAKSSGILSKLTSLEISQRDFYIPTSETLYLYEAFCHLPSLKRFKGTRLYHNQDYDIPGHSQTGFPSMLEHIELIECRIDWTRGDSLFGQPRALKSLRIDQRMIYDYKFEPLISWLRRHALTTLKSLELVNLAPLIVHQDNVCEYTIGFLNDFKVLKTLELAAANLLSHESNAPYLKMQYDPDCKWPLESILPPSLEKLTVAPSIPNGNSFGWARGYQLMVDHLFRGFAEMKAAGLLKLQEIDFQYKKPIGTRTMVKLAIEGVMVSSRSNGHTAHCLAEVHLNCDCKADRFGF